MNNEESPQQKSHVDIDVRCEEHLTLIEPEPEPEPELQPDGLSNRERESAHDTDTSIRIGGNSSAFNRVSRITLPSDNRDNDAQQRDNLPNTSIRIGGNRSAFNRVYRITLPSDNRDNDAQQTDNLPSIERIPETPHDTDREDQEGNIEQPQGRIIFERELPHAYPVSSIINLQHRDNPAENPLSQETDLEDQEGDNGEPPENPISEKPRKIGFSFLLSFILINGIIITAFLTQIRFRRGRIIDKNLNETSSSSDYKHGSQETNQTQTIQPTTLVTDSELISHHSTQDNLKCFKDPFVIQFEEWELFKRGEDPNITRTYYICPNTVISVKDFDPFRFKFIHAPDKVYPIIIFQSNVNLLCGFDGDFNNNCTFKGGYFHISLRAKPTFVNYDVTSAVENITIQGFKFTEASGGVNIGLLPERSSVVIKNCHFDNNKNLIASVLTDYNSTASSVHIQNSTFENNSFTYTSAVKSMFVNIIDIQATGVLLGYNIGHHTEVSKMHVSNSLFRNNTFLIDSDHSDFVSGAVVNLFHPRTDLKITDSCFIDNRGYSSALILLGGVEDNNTNNNNASHVFRSNSFYNNVVSEEYEVSCILNRRSTEMMVPSREFSKNSIEKSCYEYTESGNSNGTLSAAKCY